MELKKVKITATAADGSKVKATYEITSMKGVVKNVTISAQSVEVEAVMYHTKQVPLELKVTGTPDKKYGTADVSIPKEVTVKGTTYMLERVTSIDAQSIDISDVEKGETIPVTPYLPEGIELADVSEDIGVKIEFK